MCFRIAQKNGILRGACCCAPKRPGGSAVVIIGAWMQHPSAEFLAGPGPASGATLKEARA
jgi:hypothetical protein